MVCLQIQGPTCPRITTRNNHLLPSGSLHVEESPLVNWLFLPVIVERQQHWLHRPGRMHTATRRAYCSITAVERQRHNDIDQDNALRSPAPPARPGDHHHHDPPSGRIALEFPVWGALIHDATHHQLCWICPHLARLDRWICRILPKAVKWSVSRNEHDAPVPRYRERGLS